jgi:hypothetical protein
MLPVSFQFLALTFFAIISRGAAFKSSRVGEPEEFDDDAVERDRPPKLAPAVFKRRELVAVAKSAGLSLR